MVQMEHVFVLMQFWLPVEWHWVDDVVVAIDELDWHPFGDVPHKDLVVVTGTNQNVLSRGMPLDHRHTTTVTLQIQQILSHVFIGGLSPWGTPFWCILQNWGRRTPPESRTNESSLFSRPTSRSSQESWLGASKRQRIIPFPVISSLLAPKRSHKLFVSPEMRSSVWKICCNRNRFCLGVRSHDRQLGPHGAPQEGLLQAVRQGPAEHLQGLRHLRVLHHQQWGTRENPKQKEKHQTRLSQMLWVEAF